MNQSKGGRPSEAQEDKQTPSPRNELNGPFNTRIAARMKQLGMRKLEDFADHFGIGRTTVYSLVRGRVAPGGGWVKPSVDTLVKLSEALETPLHVLVYELEPGAFGHNTVAPMQSVPVGRAGWLGAGPEQNEEINDTIWVEADFARGKDLVAFRIRGDSMAAGRHPIYDGDTVIVNRLDKGHNNSQVVARLTNDGHVCKLLKEDRFSDVVRLASANPEHLNGTPTTIAPEDIAEIIGRVVRVIHDTPGPDTGSQANHYTNSAAD